MKKFWLLILLNSLFSSESFAQTRDRKNLVYVDKEGVLRYTKDNKEGAFFGVNYTVPFAYGYRSVKALGINPEKAIDADVYHMARLGLDAFRVHVWDVEISDSLGNLLQNEHLRLFDYLLKKLKERNIKILITPIAFWGNGYPEPDIKTNGFSYVYTKGGSVLREEAFKAQENYLKQFFTHVNPYTKLSYKDDPDVIAMEINNEPHHSGPKERTTEYVNRMAAAVKSTGWTKPIFYNISESPTYADAVVKANVDGHSFQWYPTGLVAGHERKGNFLPNVDQYSIPFNDTIAAFKRRAKMVYEFDAGDVMQPVMYPAMARSYRTAGFQWATQFAYDPLYTAYGNTEYQTHYLNLAYTPAKAISLLIASKAFHRLHRGKSYGTYPADTLFDVFCVSYKEQLSEMNSDEEFYYTGTTATQPKNIPKLKHVAGVGNSPVVQYEGTGAYFLDEIGDGIWRLEVMPDAIELNDPFEKASPKKEVARLRWRTNAMKILLPELVDSLSVTGAFIKGRRTIITGPDGFSIRPGIYLISKRGKSWNASSLADSAALFEPPSVSDQELIMHRPFSEVSAYQSFAISFTTTAVDSDEFSLAGSDKLSIEIRNSSNKWKTVPLQHGNGYKYKAEVPADMVTLGLINYRLMVRKANGETYTFPGGFKGNPYAWDEYRNESWKTFVSPADSPLEIFNPNTDRSQIMLYNQDWRNNMIEYITAGKPSQLLLSATMSKPDGKQFMGWQYYFSDKIAGRKNELSSVTKLVVRARAAQKTNATIALITTGADAYAANLPLSDEWKDIEIPLTALQKASFLLLPRPYPGFLPLRFTSPGLRPLNIADAERLEVTFGEGATSPVSIEVESIRLQR